MSIMQSKGKVSEINEAARRTPVFRQVEVVVIGGGAAGQGAMIASSDRSG